MQLFRSQIPHNQRQIAALSAALEGTMHLYGYEPVETPVIDSVDLFLTKAGDTIITRLFTFERHGRQLALRPEFTAAAASLYLQQGRTGTVRWQFSGAIFEDDPDDLARHYQQASVGAELIGLAGPDAEAEIIAMAAQGLHTLGITDYRVVIGHAGLTKAILSPFNLDRKTERFLLNHRQSLRTQGRDFVAERINRVLEGADLLGDSPDLTEMRDTHGPAATVRTLGGRSQREIMHRLVEKRRRSVERDQIAAALERLERWGQLELPADRFTESVKTLVPEARAEVLTQWTQTITLLESYGIRRDQLTIQPDLARSWDYYTGIVFEIRSPSQQIVAAGGRYDELVQLLGSDKGTPSVPAVGFAYYLQTLSALIRPNRVPDRQAYTLNGADSAVVIRCAQRLRAQGIPVAISTNAAQLTALADDLIQYNGTAYTIEALKSVLEDA